MFSTLRRLTGYSIVSFGVVIGLLTFFWVGSDVRTSREMALTMLGVNFSSEMDEFVFDLQVQSTRAGDYLARNSVVTQESFDDAISRAFGEARALSTHYWVPVVARADRSTLEDSGAFGGPILEIDLNGEVRAAQDRPLLAPVLMADQQGRAGFPIGLDLMSVPEVSGLLDRAVAAPFATANIFVPTANRDGNTNQPSLLIISVVRNPDAPISDLSGMSSVEGFALTMMDIPTALSSLPAHRGMEDNILLALWPEFGANSVTTPIATDRADYVITEFPDATTDRVVGQVQLFESLSGYRLTITDLDQSVSAFGMWQAWIFGILAGVLSLFVALGLLRVFADTGVETVRQKIREDVESEDDTTLRRDEERLRSIFGTMVDALITMTPGGEIESVNRAASQIFGYSESELVGRNIGIILPDSVRNMHDQYVRRYLQSGESKIMGKTMERSAVRKGGEEFPIEITVNEAKTPDLHLFTATIRDISDRKKVDAMKSEFVSTVSHELRTPLTSIRGSLGVVVNGLAGQLPEKALRLLKIAYQNSERLVGLVNDILDVERIESGQMEYLFSRHQLNDLVNRAATANEAFATELNVSFKVHPLQNDATVNADSERILQVLTNLMSNAAKFSPSGGVVDVWIKRVNDRVRVIVEDYGDGIPEEFHGKIFQRFAQADSSDTRAKGGTGLGLFIAKKITERHGGKIGFDTVRGKGTQFWFELPEEGASTEHTVQQDEKGYRVLVCEDDRSVSEYIRAVLEDEGFSVETVRTAQDGFKMANSGDFDAMTVDLMLPDRDGISLIKALRRTESGEKLKIVIISQRAEEGQERLGEGALGVEWLQKPIKDDELRAIFQKMLPGAMSGDARILVADNDTAVAEVIRETLASVGTVDIAASIPDAREMAKQGNYDVILLEPKMGRGRGENLFLQWRKLDLPAKIVAFTVKTLTQKEAGQYDGVILKSRGNNEDILNTVKSLLADENKTGA